eukprot:gene3750-15027_t
MHGSELHATAIVNENGNMNRCPVNSSFLHGRRIVNTIDTSFPFNLSMQYGGEVEIGGSWRPKDCVGKKVAFLIPFRNRNKQLNVFLRTMHPVFQRQLIDYRIFVVEQAGKEKFNKGAIYNIGFNASLAFNEYDCHVFHDVDLLSEDDRNYYGCPASPMHLSVGVDKFNYKLPYHFLVGGIQLFTKEHYQLINGYSNKFWGWGGEDDNLFLRMRTIGMKMIRPSVDIARYKMNQEHHFRSDTMNRENYNMIYKEQPKQDGDGLDGINTLTFTVEVRETLLFTLIKIDLKRK